MKNIVFFIAILIASKSFSQGNLQFNKVINYVINPQTVYIDNNQFIFSGNITIPENKVWKIESASINSTGNPAWSFILDNYVLFTWTQTAGGVVNSYWPVHFPIWLPQGIYNYTSKHYNNQGGSQKFPGASISIIEFNIIP